MKFYLASRFKTHKEVNKVAAALIALGHEVISTWHKAEAVPGYNSILPPPHKGSERDARSMFVAQRDLDEIREANALLAYTHECDLTPGGMWVEMGYALGLNKRVLILGPRTNVFCHICELVEFKDGKLVNMENHDQLFAALKERNQLMAAYRSSRTV